jgi:hypothetical protein
LGCKDVEMAQDRDTGAAANEFGRETAPRIARMIGATMLGSTSNEATLDGKRVVIKCARQRTTSIGVTYLMLDNLDQVIGAFEQGDGSFTLYALPASRFRAEMRESQSRGASAGKVGLVSRKVSEASGDSLGAVSL